MCMEDVVIGREKHVAVSAVGLAANTLTPVVGANRLRTRIAFQPSSVPQLVSPKPFDASATSGFAVSNLFGPLEFDVEDYGDLVTGPWTAFSPTNPGTLMVIEVFLNKEK